jgi:hypothetical protein
MLAIHKMGKQSRSGSCVIVFPARHACFTAIVEQRSLTTLSATFCPSERPHVSNMHLTWHGGRTHMSRTSIIVSASSLRLRRVDIHLHALLSHNSPSSEPALFLLHSCISWHHRGTGPRTQRAVLASREQHFRVFVPVHRPDYAAVWSTEAAMGRPCANLPIITDVARQGGE